MSVKGTPYNHRAIEQKWQKIWDDEKAFAATDDYSKPKYYALVEFQIGRASCRERVFVPV